jgi:hypothetical protein
MVTSQGCQSFSIPTTNLNGGDGRDSIAQRDDEYRVYSANVNSHA